ncbi:MAG: PIG-L family deacetylase [Deltaproteobacteria bacterium]|nr:PIG-L family deacetylase [Deltaproteobacteria bacterium]MBW2152314.1 PIG-L family deacetylase [Deltaproteobacteria bacterium]
MKVLVVAAHPDDEVLGCGGTISRLAHDGHDVYITILGEGITSRYKQREDADADLIEALHNRSCQVAEVLGAQDLFLYNLPDNRFDTVPILDVVKIIEELVERIQPQVIYTHHGGDLNIDHVVVHRAMLTAARPMQGQPVREIFAFEVPSSTEWSFQRFEPSFRPNVFIDISDTLNIKVQALSLYETEARPFPHPRSPEAIHAIAHRWGTIVGCEAAEAFELIRSIQ